MRVWLASFLLLFALAQVYQWAKHLMLPLPVFILGGLCLAIASNYDKRSGWPFRGKVSGLEASKSQILTVIPSANPSEEVSLLSGRKDD